MSLAIFDLDNTLIAGDSDYAWGEFLIEKKIVDEIEYKKANDYFYQQYEAGELDIEAYLRFALKPLANQPADILTSWHQEFMTLKIKPILLEKAAQLLTRHRELGDYLLIITSTNRFVTEPIAELLNVDDLLATDLEAENGLYTGRATGTPCFQEGKVERLHAWLQKKQMDLSNSYAYSDSINDLPLLQAVEHPIAVDADARLKQHAQQQGWQSMSLR